MPENPLGTPDVVAGLTAQAGTSDASPDLTEEKTVAGLSRRNQKFQEENTALKAQLAKFAADAAKADKGDQAKESEATKAENARLKIALKYTDVAPLLLRAMEKGLDPEQIDDDFVSAFRGPTTEEFGEDVPHNTLRKGMTQDEIEKNLLRNTPSLFP